MLRLDHNEDPERVELSDHGVGNLAGKPLLELEAMRIASNAACNLREARDATVPRDVADAGLPHERQDVVLAHARKGDVANNDHLLVAGLVELLAQVAARVLLHAAEYLLACPCHAIRRAHKPWPVRVLADGSKKLPHGSLDARLVQLAIGELGGPAGAFGLLWKVEVLVVTHVHRYLTVL